MIAHRGVAAKISLASPPEPGPASAPVPVPAPVPLRPPLPGPCPGPPVVASLVPTATDGVMATVGGGRSIFTGSTTGAATVGTVTAGGGAWGTVSACGEDSVGSANQLTAGRPPPPPPPRGPVPPPPLANSAAPRHNTRIAIATCTRNESAAAGPSRRWGSG